MGKGKVNVRDIGFKVLWTAIAAGLGVAATAAADLPAEVAPVAIAGINALLAYARQMLGETPPDLPPPAPRV